MPKKNLACTEILTRKVDFSFFNDLNRSEILVVLIIIVFKLKKYLRTQVR